MTLSLTSVGKKTTATVETGMFDHLAHPTIVAQAVRVFLANQRLGLAKTKTRGEVDLTKKKWFKQKGTGNARHGAQSAPIFVGGGVTHGPNGNANWKLSMSKTMRRRALQTALGIQAAESRLTIVEGVSDFSGKSKEVAQFLQNMELSDKLTLLVVENVNEALDRATRNVPGIMVVSARSLNAYIVMRAAAILCTKEALAVLEEKFGEVKQTSNEAEPTVKATTTKKPAVKKTPAKAVVKKKSTT